MDGTAMDDETRLASTPHPNDADRDLALPNDEAHVITMQQRGERVGRANRLKARGSRTEQRFSAANLINRRTQVVLDLGVLSLALLLGFMVRFDWNLPFLMFKRMMFVWPYAVLLQYIVLATFGVPRFSWRHFGLREATRVLVAISVSSAVLIAARFVSGALLDTYGHASYVLIPIGVILVDYVLAFMGIVGIRALRRILAERSETHKRRRPGGPRLLTMLVGAGEAGVMVAKEIANRPDLGIEAVGFVDDDTRKIGTDLHGLRVLGTTDALPQLCHELEVQQALLTIANATGKQIRRIVAVCEQIGIPTKIIPGLYEIVGGRVNLSRIRDVAIEDLLGREQVELDLEAIRGVVRGRCVLVTGAGGSIGSELCRQVARFEPASLLLLDQAETSLFYIEREIAATFPDLAHTSVVADICDREALEQVFAAHKISLLFHAAAYKHVPMMENNPREALRNNVFGTRVLADLADQHAVSSFVMVSTDKAVNPSSTMGASKRLAEMYIQALTQTSATKFVAVRFGNVLGSSGSAIPIFKEQLARGGPITVTHPEMRRYFMTITEACQLVLQAASMGHGGEIFILDMGEPVKIVDLARDLVRLSGLKPGEDVDIVFSGVRPGEKLFEELSVAEEHADTTRHPKIFIGRLASYPPEHVQAAIATLSDLSASSSPACIIETIKEVLPEYRPPPRQQ